ncbi:MAG: hypothetical protein IID50_03580 [Proteobacteria bacterium]|nr:hypothetical protein [Pseudomonadota bacterium]
MRRIVETFRRPPTGRIRDRNGGLPRLSDGVAHASRCPASPQRTLLTLTYASRSVRPRSGQAVSCRCRHRPT